MSYIIEFFPADGGTSLVWTTTPGDPITLMALDGVGPITVSPLTTKAPGQSGQTLLDTDTPARVVTVTGLLQAADADAFWTARAAFARALVRQPVRPGETQALGILRVTLPGHAPLEIECQPLSVNLPSPESVGIITTDVEFYAPYPFWREIADVGLYFYSSGGWSWPLLFPLAMQGGSVSQEIVNLGDVDAPVLIRMYGEATNVYMSNLTTGQIVKILTALAAGDYVEIDTSFGAKSVTLVSGATRTDLMSALDLSNADFWSLVPGSNWISFGAGLNVSGYAALYWRQRYSGI
jgi:hypothetical protein